MAKKTVYIPDDLLAATGLAGAEVNLSREFQDFLRTRLAHGYEEEPPPVPVCDLVPYAHVADLAVSVDFYALLGFEVVATVGGREQDQWWAYLQVDRARLMLAAATAPIDPAAQAVLFYLYTDDLAGFRQQLCAAGLEPSPIAHPAHMPAGELRLHDPDGYVLLVGQRRPKP
jgi:catechol 2,3-dioxygenase-like lactoylglutathione lyase family enzyme